MASGRNASQDEAAGCTRPRLNANFVPTALHRVRPLRAADAPMFCDAPVLWVSGSDLDQETPRLTTSTDDTCPQKLACSVWIAHGVSTIPRQSTPGTRRPIKLDNSLTSQRRVPNGLVVRARRR